MVEADKKRFLAVLKWLCQKYPIDGRPRPLPVGEDVTDYFAALRDLPIDEVEGGGRWHYGHSEFYPDRPAALRRSVEGWRAEQPKSPTRSFTSVAREQILAERCAPEKFEQFMSTLTEMAREKFGDSVRDVRGRARLHADQRSALQDQKRAVLAADQ